MAKRAIALCLDLFCRFSSRPVGIALCYHRVSDPPGDKARELVPALGTREFEAQVRHLTGRYRLVRASDLLEAVRSRRRGERLPVSITFDDDLPTHLRDAAPILERAGAPATFFINGASLDRAHEFWFERLQRGWDDGSVTRATLVAHGVVSAPDAISEIRGAAAAIQELSADDRAELSRELERIVGADRPDSGIRAGEVRELARAGFEIGFHTVRHDALPALDDEALDRAMSDGAYALAAAAGQPLRSISYPHGVGDARVAAAARTAGFDYGFTALGRAVTAEDGPHRLDRIYPSPGSLADFALDIARRLLRLRRA